MKTTVSIVKCTDYSPSSVRESVQQALDLLGGMERFVSPGQRVLLKPNLISPRPPSEAVTTHPAVVEAVAGLVVGAGGQSSLGDCPAIGGETPARYAHLLKVTGMQEACERGGVTPVRLDDSGSERDLPGAQVFRRLLLSDALDDADVLINLPKFKTHGLTSITGAVKNLFGCIPGRRKIEFHLQAGDDPVMFAQILVDVLRAVHPALSILDGIIGMDGQGPSCGRRREFGFIMASADPVALDAVACLAAGIEPMKIPTLRLAHEQGLGLADPREIEVLGIPIADISIPDFQLPTRGDLASRLPKPVYRLLRNHLTRSPVFLPDRCIGCRACANTCPVEAINGEANRLRVDLSKCIRCYCCQEICPHQAISLRTPALRRAVEKLIDTS